MGTNNERYLRGLAAMSAIVAGFAGTSYASSDISPLRIANVVAPASVQTRASPFQTLAADPILPEPFDNPDPPDPQIIPVEAEPFVPPPDAFPQAPPVPPPTGTF
jgi:hypothetical protein